MIVSRSDYEASIPSQASNVSQVAIVTARTNELQRIILPSKRMSVGRPTTIIGTKRKKVMPEKATTTSKQVKVFLNYFY